MTRKKKQRIISAKMIIGKGGTVSFKVRGVDLCYADLPIDVNGYLFAPVRYDRRDVKNHVTH